MRKLLLQLDSSPHPSVFDRVVGFDGGADEVMSYGSVTPDAVRDLVHGCIFTRGPKDLHNTAIFIGGLVMVLLSPLYARLRAVFPPLVTGTVVTIIGLSLIPIALGQSVGMNTPLAKTPQALILSTVTLLSIIVLNRFTRGFVKTISILLGLAVGCALAAAMGLFNFGNVAQAPWLGLPGPLPFGFAVPDPVGIGIVILSFIVADRNRAPKVVHGVSRTPWVGRTDRSISYRRATELMAQPVSESPVHT